MGRLAFVLLLTAAFACVEFATGLLSGSLALQADAAHMFTDVGALALALAAMWLGRRPTSSRATYGYLRLEIIAALINAVLLLAVAGYILYEAWQRFSVPPPVASLPMLVVAAAGLAVNVLGIVLLGRGEAGSNLNLRAAAMELFADALASVAVVLAALIVWTTGWVYADSVFGVVIALFVIPRTLKLLRAALEVLLEATPRRVDVAELERTLLAVPGVRRVHDVHVWTITSGFDAMSGHAEIDADRACGPALVQMRQLMRDRYGIKHATIQLEEPSAAGACEGDGCATR